MSQPLDLIPTVQGLAAEQPGPTPPVVPGGQFAWLREDELPAAAAREGAWLWRGYLAPGNLTLLTSQWKSGKTTLVSVLLARMRHGGELAGLPVAAARAAVVSEESPLHWLQRSRPLGFGDHVRWLCRPFKGRPRPDEWLALLDDLLRQRAHDGLDLVVIDPLAAFLPGGDENRAG